jgi:diguanylate cyclase (GGDEF)-like protein
MKRLVVALGIVCWAAAYGAQPSLTTLRAVHSLSNAEAKQQIPVDFEGTVTYYDNQGTDLFVQDGEIAVYVFAKPGAQFVPGDRVRVQGRADSDFRPDVIADEVTLLHHGTVPDALPATFAQLIRVELDCVRVKMHGRVRSADIVKDKNETNIYLNLRVEGGYIDATVLGRDENKLKDLLDAEVEITGAVAGKFDSKMQLAGIMLQVPSLSDVKIVRTAETRIEALPITPMDEILSGFDVGDHTRRVRVRGTITYYQPGTAIALQDGAKSLWVATQFEGPLKVGQVADVSGFPDTSNGYATLTHSEVTQTGLYAPVLPQPSDWTQLASGKHAFELVSVEGTVLVAVRGAAQDEYVLTSGDRLFSAIYPHPDLQSSSLPAMKPAAVGSRVRVTGICTMERGSNPLGDPVAFHILVRGFEDVQVIEGPPWLNRSHLMRLVGVLLIFILIASARGWILERRVRRQTAILAARIEADADMERRRSRILEDINAGRDLAEVLERITALVSFSLKGSPCWCMLANGLCIGDHAARTGRLSVVRHEIPARSGPPHGTILAAVDPSAEADPDTLNALAMGAALCAVAIETRGLYSVLIHRSEFDLLTDIHNRFSFERALESAIERARPRSEMLGLIYIDLDKFKEINDAYGHRVGDIFLQEAARRMKHQLRPDDMLARLGGDEFGVIVRTVQNKADVQEIAARLEHCFDHPFMIESYLLTGSASVGVAFYPEDGETKDSFLSAADAAMYVAKNTKMATSDLPVEED